jgi:hypothetical protein
MGSQREQSSPCNHVPGRRHGISAAMSQQSIRWRHFPRSSRGLHQNPPMSTEFGTNKTEFKAR